MDYNFPRLVVRRMLSFPGINRRRNRRHLHNLQERRTAQQTVLQVNQVVFSDGSSVAGAGGNLDTEVTTNTESNDYQFLVTDRGITDALEVITAESVTVNQYIINNVNKTADDAAINLDTNDQLPNLSAWHNVTPIDLTPPDQDADSFVYAKSATTLINEAVYTAHNEVTGAGTVNEVNESYLEIKEPGVYEIEADMYWVSQVSVGTEKTIATQLYISRDGQSPYAYASNYSGIGPVSTCFMFGNVRMGSTSVSTVTQCAAGDRVRVMAVGTLASSAAPEVTSPPGRSSLRVRRISNHFNGHLSYSTSAGAGFDIQVYRGLPEGIPISDYTSTPLINNTISSDWSITRGDAHTWLSGARDYYIKIDPIPQVSNGSGGTRDAVVTISLIIASPLEQIDLITEHPTDPTAYHADYSKYVELLSGTFTDGLVRFKCGPHLNSNDLKAGIVNLGTPVGGLFPIEYFPTGWLHYSFS